MPDDVRQIILDTIESYLEAQLSAVRKLRGKKKESEESSPQKRASNLSIVFDILKSEGQPLHSSEIIKRAQTRFDRHLDRESLVSALTKCVARKDRFTRPAPNTFALLPDTDKEEPTAS